MEPSFDRSSELHDLLRSRQSVRSYKPDPVSNESIQRILESACSAPSAHNRQPWRFVVVTDPSQRETVAAAMGARLQEDRLADGDPQEAVDIDVNRSKARIAGAPVLIFVFVTLEDMDSYLDAKRQSAEQIMAIQSAAMAMQNALLAAYAEGLGACIMCAPLFCPEVVRSVLRTPVSWSPQSLVTIGFVDMIRGKKPRRRLTELVRSSPQAF